MIVGLGNPGPSYRLNRHNVGFQVLDVIASHCRFPEFHLKNQALSSKQLIGDQLVFLLKPLTFMNLSGKAVASFARFYHIPLNQIWVVHDDLDLAPGKIRVKLGGGTGGHRGLQSIDQSLGKDYRRLRVGIGHPGNPERVHDYVLKDFTPQEDVWLKPLLDYLTEFFPLLLENKADVYVSKVMQKMQPYLSSK
ncbi:MAG: aminoacyl-tRNA hydrolase [Alphaproteobacteria bacterium]